MSRVRYNLVSFQEPSMGTADIFGIISVVITFTLSVIAVVTPYWTVCDNPPDHVVGPYHNGLLVECYGNSCTGLFEDNMFMQRHYPAWFQATQALMAVGLTCGLVALLVATLSLCCTCHSCNPNHTVAGCLVVACLTMAVGIAIFGIKAADEWNLKMDWDYVTNGRFGWSFWVAVGATVAALFTSIVYGCMGRKYQA